MWSGEAVATDFRSDAVTLPTTEMWDAMRSADIGWARADEDRNVTELEELGASMCGFEAGLYLSSGSAGNLVATLSHTQPGQQVILENYSHMVWCEEANIASIGGLFPRLLPGNSGAMGPDAILAAVLETHLRHRPRTGLVVLENTHNLAGGAALTASYTSEVIRNMAEQDIPVHIDGARIFNAAAALGASVHALAGDASSLVVNLNKGLSAPAGSLLLGSAQLILNCRRKAKEIAAAPIHQAGLLAAAGLVALRTMVPQLAEDNARASRFAALIKGMDGLDLVPVPVRTNIVLVRLASDGGPAPSDRYLTQLSRGGVRAMAASADCVRFVFHRHITDEAVNYAAAVMSAASNGQPVFRGPLESGQAAPSASLASLGPGHDY